MDYEEIIRELKGMKNPKNVEGMRRFGIRGEVLLGISVVELRKIAKKTGKNHDLAVKLWNSGIHEARIIAPLIEIPEKVTKAQVEQWVSEIDSWDVCDMLTGSLLDQLDIAIEAMFWWAKDEREYVRRTPFSMMAWIANHNKVMKDEEFEKYFCLIKNTANDERNFVRKAVNWALRGIGKRNLTLRKRALEVAYEIREMDSKAARWIANDAIRELSSTKTVEMITKRSKKI